MLIFLFLDPNERPNYDNGRGGGGYRPYPPPPPPQAAQHYAPGPTQAAGYYHQSYGDPAGGSGPADQQYYPDQRKRRGEYEYGRYNTIGPR